MSYRAFPNYRREVLYNKVFDGGKATNSTCLILPKNTTANLAAMDRTEGMLAYDTDLDLVVIDTGTGFVPVNDNSSVGQTQDGGSVNLGSAASYALLAASAITNSASAPSVVSGNMGISPNGLSSITGFPPGSVINGAEHGADASAATAQTDALATFTALNTLTATLIPAILDGQTLTPGVYKEASSTFSLAESGAGTLTLNGAGTYIFQAASTLRTGAGGAPTITLSGGATASNTYIYWAVGSSATINIGVSSANSIFRGTIIAQASITVTQGGSTGRLIALTGAVTLSNATNVAGTAVSSPLAASSSTSPAVLTFTSGPGSSGVAGSPMYDVTFSVPGLLATDTILSVIQKTAGASGTLALLGYINQANNSLVGKYVADPGVGSVVVVTVIR